MIKRGFTLIEFLIYSAILGMVLVLSVGFLWDMVFGQIKEASYEEVQENSRFALMKISQEIKRAKAVNNPAPGFSSNTLSLSMNNPSFNPTIFDVVDGKLRITIGSSGPYELTSNQVIVNSLRFTNLSYPNTPGIIRIEMTVSHINPGNQSEYQAVINLSSSVSLLPGGAL
jgi:prepilin-type N-terminal cleavage/methylation domain-containing protein